MWLAAGLPARAEPAAGSIDPELKHILKATASEADTFPDRFDAEVWLTDMSRRLEQKVPDTRCRIELLKHVHCEATRAGLVP